jgi:hypothetical protein
MNNEDFSFLFEESDYPKPPKDKAHGLSLIWELQNDSCIIPEELFLTLDDLRFWWLCADARALAKSQFTDDIVLDGIRDAINAKPRNYADEVCLDFVRSLGLTPEEVIEKAKAEAVDAECLKYEAI